MEGVLRDLSHSIRMLRRNLVFTVTATAALALGIGANTAIFSVISAVFLMPLPYPDPGHIVIFTTASQEGSTIAAASPTKFNVWRQQTNVFQEVSAYRFGLVNLTGVDRPEQIQSALVSASYFRLFGQRVARGRAFTEDEDRPNGGDVVILSDAFWERTFGADPGIIGRTISLSGRPYEVIGIMPSGVQIEAPASFEVVGATEPIDIWMPLQIDANSTDQNGYLNVAARLKPGVALPTAVAQLQLAMQEFRRKFPAEDVASASVFAVQPMREALVGRERPSLSVLSIAVGLVLLIACANAGQLIAHYLCHGQKAGDRHPSCGRWKAWPHYPSVTDRKRSLVNDRRHAGPDSRHAWYPSPSGAKHSELLCALAITGRQSLRTGAFSPSLLSFR